MKPVVYFDENEIGFLTDLRHKIHSRPCLSGIEKETADIITIILEECNPDKIYRNIGGHGILAVFEGKEDGNSVLLRCELDALPIYEKSGRPYASIYENIAHSCGHDGHMAVMCGVAGWIAKNRESLLAKGSIYLLFQGEEETGAGALKMADWMKENGIGFDYAIAFHNWPGIKRGTVEIYPECYAWASVGIKIELFGQTSHASEPEKALNPTDAVMELIEKIKSLNTALSFSTIVGVNIGDLDYGITPGNGFVALTSRSQTDEGLETLKNNIIDSAKNIVDKNPGLKIKVSTTDYFPATLNTPALTGKIKEIAEKAGYRTELNHVGTKGSDDFVHIAKMARKGATFFDIGSGENHPPLHRPDFDFDDSLIPAALDIICLSCLDILQCQ